MYKLSIDKGQFLESDVPLFDGMDLGGREGGMDGVQLTLNVKTIIRLDDKFRIAGLLES